MRKPSRERLRRAMAPLVDEAASITADLADPVANW
jgi:hypothetical protein